MENLHDVNELIKALDYVSSLVILLISKSRDGYKIYIKKHFGF